MWNSGSGIGPNGGCLAVIIVLALIGMAAVVAGLYWLLSNITIVWGGP